MAKFTVIGGGVVGLAIASKLSQFGSLILIEQERWLGSRTSSRNSQVIHNGLYYPEGTLKSTLCIRGNRMLYEYAAQNNIPYHNCQKWILAQDNPDQIQYLHTLKAKADTLLGPGMCDFVSIHNQKADEPNVRAKLVLNSTTSGIINVHSYMDSLREKIIQNSGDIILNTTVRNIEKCRNGYSVYTADTLDTSSENLFKLESDCVINCAGLGAIDIANMVGIQDYKYSFCKGHYLRYASKDRLASRLLYPCPDPSLTSLGVHLTLDMNGSIRFGPDVHFTNDPHDYSFSSFTETQSEKFYHAIANYLPDIDRSLLVEDYTGIRPKIAIKHNRFHDFVIAEEGVRGLSNFVNLIGIESPGLTSSLAIAEMVAKLLE